MAPLDQPIDAEADDEKARAELDRTLPLGQHEQEREWQQHEKRCQEMSGGQSPQRTKERARALVHEPGRNGERPAHSRIDPVIETARNKSEPQPAEARVCPI
jgi:hypothetical protein